MNELELSAIIFSRNDVEEAFKLIKDIYAICDEIVIIDQSDFQKHKFLIDKKRENKLNKLKIFYSVALGDPAPLRMWGLSKCMGRWVLLIDTDERLNPAMKRNIRKLIATKKYNAYAIKRNEYFMRKNKFETHGFTWQIRLYKKDNTEYRGLTHEFPSITGSVGKLEEKYSMDHYFNNGERPREYFKLNKFQCRMSYRTMNKEIDDYLFKFFLSKDSFTIRTVKSIVVIYEKLGFKKLDQELSNLDYFTFNFIENIGLLKRVLKKISLRDIFKLNIERLKQIKKLKKEKDAKEVFKISEIINNIGIIKFLDLDKDSTIKELIKKYKNKKQGIDLLIYLLKQKFRQTSGNNK